MWSAAMYFVLFLLLLCAAIERVIAFLLHMVHSLRRTMGTAMIHYQLTLSAAFDMLFFLRLLRCAVIERIIALLLRVLHSLIGTISTAMIYIIKLTLYAAL